MKKLTFITGVLFLLCFFKPSLGQGRGQSFKMSGINILKLPINQLYTSSTEIFPFEEELSKIYGMSVNADVNLTDESGLIRLILIDKNYKEYLVYETYQLLEKTNSFSVSGVSEETCILNGVHPNLIKLEIINAEIMLESLSVSTQIEPGTNADKIKKEKKNGQDTEKINRINANIKSKGKHWIAGDTDVSVLTYSEKKQLFGQSTFPAGFEYYAGGVISTGSSLKSASAGVMVNEWDWRNRHGQNWITSIKNQGSCGSCWAFAATGATEAMVKVFYNRSDLDLNLSEQDLLSCSGAGSCSGGYPSVSLDYIRNNGIVDEATFPYTASDQPCENKGTNSSNLIQIGGRVNYGSSEYPRTEDDLKRLIIEKGPISGGIYDWSHAMVLVGYKVVEEGDHFYYGNGTQLYDSYWLTIGAGDPLIGKTVWFFKNSWGNWGNGGYGYFEVDISNIGWTHGILTPLTSQIQNYQVVCEDNDGDGYYWWGLGEKPIGCNCPDTPDGDDSNPNLGPLDEYGNCTVLGLSPVADFSANPTSVNEGEAVTFTDLSLNNPMGWEWTFEGGTPSTSNDKNPTIVYNTAGTYSVSLTVTNSEGTDTKLINDLITVEEYVPSYCDLSGDASAEWISKVQLGDNTNISGSGGYEDFTNVIFNFESGKTYDLSLIPDFNPRNKFEYWAVWIDYNNNMDFDDPGELVFTASKKRSGVYGSVSIPSDLEVDTRMRIAMSRSGISSSCGTVDLGEVEDYAVHIGVPEPLTPVADFSSSKIVVQVGEAVSFTDLTQNLPTNWSWNFEGGEPDMSSEQNPVIIYYNTGTFDVSLTAGNAQGSDTETKTDFITVTETAPADYCEPFNVNSSSDFIQNVIVGNVLQNGSIGDGYTNYTNASVFTAGQNYDVSLTPSLDKSRNFWRIWMDFNNDGDFDDSDEALITANNKKGVYNATIQIPSYATGETRMRVTMRTGSSPSSCDDGFDGEVEDYAISFGSATAQLKDAKIQTDKIWGGVRIYPNPAQNKINLQVDKVFIGDFYTVLNMDGEKILQGNMTSKISEVDISRFASGVYIITVRSANNLYNERFVKY